MIKDLSEYLREEYLKTTGVDPCYECTGYGDDYMIDEDGDLICNCPTCPYNKGKKKWFGKDGADDERTD